MAFAPPSLADQFFQPGVLARPNPDLGAERVRNDWQLQVTSKTFDWGGVTANGSVSLFRADVDGMILWFPDFRFIWSPDNYDVRRRGAEVGATVAVPWADLSLTGGLSAVAVEYRGPVLSGQVAYRPRYSGNATLSASAFGLRPSVRYRYIGRRRTIPGSELNTLSPFSVVDLQVSRPVALAGRCGRGLPRAGRPVRPRRHHAARLSRARPHLAVRRHRAGPPRPVAHTMKGLTMRNLGIRFRRLALLWVVAASGACSDDPVDPGPRGFLEGTESDPQIGLVVNSTGKALTLFQLGDPAETREIPFGPSSAVTPVGFALRGTIALVPLGEAASVALVDLEGLSIDRFFTFPAGNATGRPSWMTTPRSRRT